MSNLRLFALSALPLWLLISALLVIAHREIAWVGEWAVQFNWLPLVLATATGVLAAQFGQSRLLYAALGVLAILYFDANNEGLDKLSLSQPLVTALILFSLACATLSVMRDTGIALVNVGQSVLILAIPIGLYQLMVFGIDEWSSAAVNNMRANLTETITDLPGQLSLTLYPAALFTLAVGTLISLVRALWLPTFTHINLLIAQCVIWQTLFAGNQPVMLFALTLLSAAMLAGILLDTFRMAFRDELTGIPSRRALYQFVKSLGKRYTVVMCDIDHFKKFNDTHGHDVGDQVLKLVASKLRQVTGGGRAFRYGGEEFTIVFARKSPDEVIPHVNMVREIIERYDIILRDKNRPKKPPKDKPTSSPKQKKVKVTCSFGVAEKQPELDHFDAVMKLSDTALYAAKKAGRNCVKQAKQ